jgi:DNA mismatch repair protein MutS
MKNLLTKLPHTLHLLILIFCIVVTQNNNCKSIYKNIQWLNLSSLEWEDEEWPNESFNDYLHRCFHFQAHLQAIKKRKIVFDLFDSLSEQREHHNCLYDLDTIQDLNLFAGQKAHEPYIAEIINRTNTELGKVFLYGLISTPINDIHTLLSRQKIIRLFTNNIDLYNQIDVVYKQLTKSENMLLSLWAQDGFLQSSKRHYFSFSYFHNLNEKLNRSAFALELKSLWDHQQRAMYVISGLIASILLPTYGISKTIDTPLPTAIENAAEKLQGSGGSILALLSSFSNDRHFTAGMFMAAGVLCALTIKETYEWFNDNITLDNCIQKKMIHIAHFFTHIILLSRIIQSHPELIDICPGAACIDTFMKTDFLAPDVQKLFTFFTSPTLRGKASLFSMQGRVLAAFKLIYDLKEKLEPLLLAIGEIDAYFSCAKLYKEFANKRVQFCFAHYKTDAQPSIIMNDFWNPFIDPEKVIPNSINLHGPDKKNMIITGPNAGGKSTLIKALPINLILSQTIGIAAASYIEITPFHSIATYLNIVDDIAEGNSLFKAQVLRAQEMISAVEQTPETEFSFVALDEMFNGTSAKESMAAAYSVVKHLGKYSNNISIIATHFPLLTALENECATFANYKVSVEINENGIHYPFILEQGISTQHIALDILKQEGYDFSILAQATEILKNISV